MSVKKPLLMQRLFHSERKTKRKAEKMNIWAHRGCSRYLPENTIPAFTEAAKLPGICGIETDVQLTWDGEIVIFHDEQTGRVLQESGYVKDYTLAELRRIPFRLKRNGTMREGAGQPETERAACYAPEDFYVPTLSEFLEAMKPYCEQKGLLLNIELKTSVIRYEGIEQKTIDRIRALGMEKYIVFSSFLADSIGLTKQLAPEIPTGMLADALEDCIRKGTPMQADAWHPDAEQLTVSHDDALMGKPIRAWNIREILYHSDRTDPGIDYRTLSAQGVTDIFVNEPEKYCG